MSRNTSIDTSQLILNNTISDTALTKKRHGLAGTARWRIQQWRGLAGRHRDQTRYWESHLIKKWTVETPRPKPLSKIARHLLRKENNQNIARRKQTPNASNSHSTIKLTLNHQPSTINHQPSTINLTRNNPTDTHTQPSYSNRNTFNMMTHLLQMNFAWLTCINFNNMCGINIHR